MDQRELAKLAMDLIHRTMTHHIFWLKEIEHQMGFEEALSILDQVYDTTVGNQLNRLSKLMGFKMNGGIPEVLLDMPREKMLSLMEGLSSNWLAGDGIWFQAVEGKHGMFSAKRCNDSCWAWFSPFEAWSIKRLLEMEEQPGLEGLKQALPMRLYAQINIQSIIEETEESIVLQMNRCRVQWARKNKGLDDYPCKSAGCVEYSTFAKAIDARIKTECIGCPPDHHPEEWFCAWRFQLIKE